MGSTKDTGREGEREAADHLKRRGYKIIETNYTCRHGEIDLVVRKRKTLVFVEVKSARGRQFGRPVSWVDERKQKKLATLAAFYLQQHELEGVEVRFDVVGVEWEAGRPQVVHLEDAFRP
ncbi:YraN family protein [candidate division KSB1 bacterium]